MESGIGSFKDLCEVVASVVVVLGLPAGLLGYLRAKRKEQRDREYGTYDELDDKYIEFQRLCLEHPELDVWDVPDASMTQKDPVREKREKQVFTILFSIFERAYLMYSDMSSDVKRRQWSGWALYIRSYAARANFRRAWETSGSTFEEGFQGYMNAELSKSA